MLIINDMNTTPQKNESLLEGTNPSQNEIFDRTLRLFDHQARNPLTAIGLAIQLLYYHKQSMAVFGISTFKDIINDTNLLTQANSAYEIIKELIDETKDIRDENDLNSVERIFLKIRDRLNTISTSIQLLMEINDFNRDEKINSAIEMCLSSITNLSSLTYQFYSHLLDGQIEKEYQPLNCIGDQILQEVYSAIKYSPHSEINFFDHTGDLNPGYVNINLFLLKQAINNLIANALKYNESSQKIIQVATMHINNELVIYIEDNGIGILPDDMPHIFKLDYRGQNQSSEGTGLGLYFVKKFVDLHEGSISVESKPGIGTKFTIKIPTYIQIPENGSNQKEAEQ